MTAFHTFLRSVFLLFGLSVLSAAGIAHAQKPATQDLYKACEGKQASFEKTLCLEPYFKAVTREQSAEFAIEIARDLMDQGKIDDCHIVAHMVGKENLYKYDYDLGKALATCSMTCIQGCIHGAVQTYISEKIDSSEIADILPLVCKDIKDNKILRHQCIHGVGHGLLTGKYLPVKDALEGCQKFEGEDIQTCLGGLFMENMQHHLLVSEEELRKRLPTVCDKVIETENANWIQQCFIAIGEGLMFYTAHDLEKSMEMCKLSSAVENHQNACMIGAEEEQLVMYMQKARHHGKD